MTQRGNDMDELDIYQRQGLGHESGVGRQCGLVLVDFINGFVDPALLGGAHVSEAAQRTQGLLHAFRERNWPVAHARMVYAEDGSDHNVFCRKTPSLTRFTETADCSQIVPGLAPFSGEYIVRKQGASAFFATGLADWLRGKGVDTAVVVGCTTSGCVRATALDAMQHNFLTVVVADCVGDRAVGPHRASLFDMGQKYADVMDRDELISLFS